MSERPDEGQSDSSLRESDFDHENARKMNRVLPITVNNEHWIYGNNTPKEIEIAKSRVRLSIIYAKMAMGDVDEEMSLMADGAVLTADAMLPRSRGGFERKIGNTAFNVDTVNVKPENRGALQRIWRRNRNDDQSQQPVSR